MGSPTSASLKRVVDILYKKTGDSCFCVDSEHTVSLSKVIVISNSFASSNEKEGNLSVLRFFIRFCESNWYFWLVKIIFSKYHIYFNRRTANFPIWSSNSISSWKNLRLFQFKVTKNMLVFIFLMITHPMIWAQQTFTNIKMLRFE